MSHHTVIIYRDGSYYATCPFNTRDEALDAVRDTWFGFITLDAFIPYYVRELADFGMTTVQDQRGKQYEYVLFETASAGELEFEHTKFSFIATPQYDRAWYERQDNGVWKRMRHQVGHEEMVTEHVSPLFVKHLLAHAQDWQINNPQVA